MRKVLFIVSFLIAPVLLLGYGVSTDTLKVFKKADKIQQLFKANKSDKWVYKFDNQNHIFLWGGKSFSFKRDDIVLIVHNRNSLNNINIKPKICISRYIICIGHWQHGHWSKASTHFPSVPAFFSSTPAAKHQHI